MKLLTIILAPIATFVLVAPISMAHAGGIDIDQVTAALTAISIPALIDPSIHKCLATFQGDEIQLQGSFAALVWYVENEKYFLAADAILRDRPKDLEPGSAKLPPASAQNLALGEGASDTQKPRCSDFFGKIQKHQFDLQNLMNSAQAKLLDDYAHSHATLRQQTRNEEMVLGCMKAAFNKGGRNIPAMQNICGCTIGSMLKFAKDDEVESYLAKVSNEGEALNYLFRRSWFPKMMKSPNACSSSPGNFMFWFEQ
jgi:hypothetical protein